MLSEELNELGIKAASGEEADVQDRDLPGICFFCKPYLVVSSLKNEKKSHFLLFGFDFLWNDGILYFINKVWGISSVG